MNPYLSNMKVRKVGDESVARKRLVIPLGKNFSVPVQRWLMSIISRCFTHPQIAVDESFEAKSLINKVRNQQDVVLFNHPIKTEVRSFELVHRYVTVGRYQQFEAIEKF